MSKYYESKSIKIPSTGRDIELLIFQPTKNKKPKEKTPGILWIHGGGYITGMARMIYMSRAIDLVKKYGAVVVTPEYRLSNEAPYPAALEDCYASLMYLKEHADELGINRSQIMVGKSIWAIYGERMFHHMRRQLGRQIIPICHQHIHL